MINQSSIDLTSNAHAEIICSDCGARVKCIIYIPEPATGTTWGLVSRMLCGDCVTRLVTTSVREFVRKPTKTGRSTPKRRRKRTPKDRK